MTVTKPVLVGRSNGEEQEALDARLAQLATLFHTYLTTISDKEFFRKYSHFNESDLAIRGQFRFFLICAVGKRPQMLLDYLFVSQQFDQRIHTLVDRLVSSV